MVQQGTFVIFTLIDFPKFEDKVTPQEKQFGNQDVNEI